MEHHAEPLPPGILPNFPPNYPLQWRHKLLPDPHPNELRSLGLPTAFSSYGRPRRGYGGYENCYNFNGADKNEQNDSQLAMQEDYWEELMLQQNRAQQHVGPHDNNVFSHPHMLDHSWQPQWGDRQMQEWHRPSNSGRQCSNFEFEGVHTKRKSNGFRGQKYNSRGGCSGNVGRGGQVNVRSSQECYIHHPPKSAPLGEVFVPSGNDNSCEPAEEEEEYQRSRLWYSDEYAAFDDDPDWDCDEEANASGSWSNQFPQSAPAPSSIDHYYNLAPQKQGERKRNGLDSVANREVAIARKLNYLRRQFRERVCEVCVIGFPRVEQYHKHLRSHAKCMYPGCQFEACIEVLDGHITREHLLNPAVNTPISDEEYRRQRRNKFPTQAKKELQQALAELQKKRGELLGIKPNKTEVPNVESSKDGADGGKSVRVKKRLLRADENDEKKKLKKSRFEKTLKVIRMEQNPHETDDNFIVYSRIPEFRGTDAFDEEMGVKSCFADTIQSGDVVLADVPAFHISDDDEDSYQPTRNGDEMSASSSFQDKPSRDYSDDGEGVPGKSSDLNSVHVGIAGTHLTCNNEKASIPAAENAIREVDPSARGALSLLIGDYGSASESENETLESKKLNDNGPLESSVFSDLGEGNFSQRRQAVNYEVGVEDSHNINKNDSPKVEDQAVDTETQPKAEKKSRHRRGKRGLKKRKKPTCSETADSGTSFGESAMAASPNGEGVEVDVTPSYARTSESVLPTSKTCLTTTSAGLSENQSSLFPHLKAINSRRDYESEDDEDIIVEKKPWHVRNEEALAARCVSLKYKKFRSKYKTSLLEKLLQDEVRFERNVLLQCAKYIVEHNFFDVGKESQNCTEGPAQEQGESSADSSNHDDDAEIKKTE